MADPVALTEEKHALLNLLNVVVPFRFLPHPEKLVLVDEMFLFKAAPFQVIFRPGAQDREIFLLEEGQVELTYDDNPEVKLVNVIRSGHYFGERSALLDQNRGHGARAVTAVRCWALAGPRLLDLIRRFPVFAQAFGTILRDKHGIFLPLQQFITEVERSMAMGWLPLHRLKEVYKKLEPAIHPLANDPDQLDLDALVYAVRRLPANLTATYSWFLTDDIPAAFHHPSDMFPVKTTNARRRDVWELHPGKNMVLLRNGLSDVLDLVTCLCLFSVEARKLRHRIQTPELLRRFREFLFPGQRVLGAPPGGVAESDPQAFLGQLPFSSDEARGLWKIWGPETIQCLYEICLHHEDFNLVVERQLNNYNSRRSEKWIVQIAKAVRQLLNRDISELGAGLEVHIISSNTHSVANCLSPQLVQRAQEILEWGRRTDHPLTRETWEVQEDLLYSLLPDFAKVHRDTMPTPAEEFEWGILRLNDTASTGIAVQIVDCRKLVGRAIDPGIAAVPADRDILIINIDYAFGEQADEILRNLITLFSHHIKSVNILGKAGALTGKRGGILVPTAFIKQADDMFQPLPVPEDAVLDKARSRLRNITFTVGPLLTVDGTLLQNRALLNFYRSIWHCIGLEMEGVYYARQVIEAVQLGLLPAEVVQRYFYYVSDLPLETGSNLTQPLAAAEGVPPVYAVTRTVLDGIFQGAVR